MSYFRWLPISSSCSSNCSGGRFIFVLSHHRISPVAMRLIRNSRRADLPRSMICRTLIRERGKRGVPGLSGRGSKVFCGGLKRWACFVGWFNLSVYLITRRNWRVRARAWMFVYGNGHNAGANTAPGENSMRGARTEEEGVTRNEVESFYDLMRATYTI